MASYIWLCVAIPLISSGLLLVLGKRSNTWGHWLSISASAASFVVAFITLLQVLGRPSAERVMDASLYKWIATSEFSVDLAMRVDPLSLSFLMLVTFVGTLIHIYSVAYMEHDPDRRRFFAYLNFFVASMLLLVLGNSYLVLFFGWEGVGLASFLLISFWDQKPENATAGKKAFVMNRVGDMGMIIAMVIMFAEFKSVDFMDVSQGVAHVSQGTSTAIGIFLLVAACGKSAQFPLQAWLGDAMAGPTPVSALIHAATMVTAGVYLMVRSGAIYAQSETAQLLVAVIGLITLIFGAIVGAAKDDMKKVLAASTMSQIGYMMLAAGLGPVGAAFGIFHLVTHGAFKANMFLGAGSVMHAMNDEVDIRGFGGLRKYMPKTFYTFGAGYLAIIGLVFLSGYWSKDKIIEAAFTTDAGHPWIFGTATLIVAGVTAFYMSRLFFAIFFGKERFDHETHHPHEAPALMWVPQAILAFGSLFLGGFLSYIDFPGWLAPAIGESTLHHAVDSGHLVLPSIVITISVQVVMVIGVLLAWVNYGKDMPKVAPEGNALTRAARRDLFQDDINENLFMKPGIGLTTALSVVDEKIVDGAVEGTGKLTPALGRWFAKFQNGYARSYASLMLAGIVIVLLIALAGRMF
ncbi:MAG: NADH-quinone oxidoreductase subunit L [Actinomycetaceae bacterium]|nr:NADH-quinone oxidoreductase subunit L [Actinomycetaceae bacterium]